MIKQIILGTSSGILLVFAIIFSTNAILLPGPPSFLYISSLSICFLTGYYFIWSEAVDGFMWAGCLLLITIHILLLIQYEELISVMKTTGFNSLDILVWVAILGTIWQNIVLIIKKP